MNERTQETPLAASILAESLEYATNDLVPNSNYRLELDGVSKKRYIMKEIGIKNGVTPDEKEGVSMSLSYNDLTNRLELDKLSMQLEGQPGSKLEIVRTRYMGYLSLVTIGRAMHQGYAITDPQYGESLLAEYAINDKPNTENAAEYSLWRADLLHSTNGWRLNESMTVSAALDIEMSSDLTINRQEIVNSNLQQSTKILSVGQSITIFPNENNDTTLTHHETAELTKRNYTDRLNLYSHTTSLRPDFLVDNNDEIIESDKRAIRLDEDTYHRFKNLIDEATAYKIDSKI
ncbi:MAG TPA: hypothetical protein VFS65_01230 [Candidatus Saccharimonadales bacterium]|nr:hypothetical protein [Candidatus Saccharimonadales bacterium]